VSGRRAAAWACALALLTPTAWAQDTAAPNRAAAVSLHSAAADTLQVRALMQAGEYRLALGWAAHLAGAHPDRGDGAALYGWLLHLGGQTALAVPVVEAAVQRWPDNSPLSWVQAHFGKPGAGWNGPSAPPLLAPVASLEELPAASRVVASATWVDALHALAPLSAIAEGQAMWVRDGLGRTRHVSVERSDATLGLALLRLDAPLAGDAAPLRAPQAPHPGSVAYAAGYAPGDGTPQWPALAFGFLGRVDAPGGAGSGSNDRSLGFALPAATAGGPVFDAAGRWVGVASAHRGDASRFIPIPALRALLGDGPATVSADEKPARLAADAVYEIAMRLALQLILRQTPWNTAPSTP
jgi:Trypsin-like peptidase domain